MDRETMDFLEKMYIEMQQGFKGINSRIDTLERDVKELKDGQQDIKALINNLEPVNANRHLELTGAISELRKDLTNVEIITSSNWNEIAKLKAVK